MTKQQDKSENLNQVYQGGFMRENASFWSKLTFGYAKPLLDSSMKQQIQFEQYGELPDRLKICHEAKLLEDQIGYYHEKDNYDQYAFMKGMISVNRWKFFKFYAVRCALMFDDLYQPLLLVSFIAWITDNEQEDTMWSYAYALLIGLMIPLLKGL